MGDVFKSTGGFSPEQNDMVSSKLGEKLVPIVMLISNGRMLSQGPTWGVKV